MENKEKKQYPEGYFINQWMAIGIALGLPLGIPMGNIALGILIGLAIGLAIGTSIEKKYKEQGLIRALTEEEKSLERRNFLLSW